MSDTKVKPTTAERDRALKLVDDLLAAWNHECDEKVKIGTPAYRNARIASKEAHDAVVNAIIESGRR